MTWPNILGFTVLAAVITTAGSLLAMFIKEFVAARWLDRYRARQTLLGVYRNYQLPIFLAAEELSSRLYGLSREDNDREQREVGLDLLRTKPGRERHAGITDHYLLYRFTSNVYRLCTFLGWIELYRRDIGTLDVDSIDRNHRLEACLNDIRCALADGWINQHDNWRDWGDCMIFREELRAIGHRMATPDQRLCVMDFGTFSEILERDPDGNGDGKWFVQAAHFFENLKRVEDFRIVRMKMLVAHLTALMELLQPGRVDPQYLVTAQVYRDSFDEIIGGPGWRPQPLSPNALPVHS